jgi:RNA polymerase sigma-70 factor (ECF subfamily)
VAKLFDKHGRMVFGLCRLLLRDTNEAEDAAQQVFLSAQAAVVRGAVPRDAPRWLAAIARNECRARVQARMREPLALPELPSDLPDPLAAAIRATDLDAIWAAISSLPRAQRRALLLRELGGLSYHELGRALGMSQSAVESLLFRARQHVRRFVAAATPLAFRDDLSRFIPGFDSGTAGVAARVVTLPVALKLATAAVSVGVVTGASHLPQHHPRHRSPTLPAARVTEHAQRVVRHFATAPAPELVVHRTVRSEGHDGKKERAARHEVEVRHEPVQNEHETVQVDQRETESQASNEGDAEGSGPGPTESESEDHFGDGGGDSHSGSDSSSDSSSNSGD